MANEKCNDINGKCMCMNGLVLDVNELYCVCELFTFLVQPNRSILRSVL